MLSASRQPVSNAAGQCCRRTCDVLLKTIHRSPTSEPRSSFHVKSALQEHDKQDHDIPPGPPFKRTSETKRLTTGRLVRIQTTPARLRRLAPTKSIGRKPTTADGTSIAQAFLSKLIRYEKGSQTQQSNLNQVPRSSLSKLSTIRLSTSDVKRGRRIVRRRSIPRASRPDETLHDGDTEWSPLSKLVLGGSRTVTGLPHRTAEEYQSGSELTEIPVDVQVLEDVKPPSEMQPVPSLAHGLDRVLFNPGVHWLQDPRSRVYNFTPELENIPSVHDFDFDRLGAYVTSSRDKDLHSLAKTYGKRFAGSTSSLTGILSHIYLLLSGSKEPSMENLSMAFANEPRNFTAGQHMPASVSFRFTDGVYLIDSGISGVEKDKFILIWLGTLLEKFLTLSSTDFSKLLRSPCGPLPPLPAVADKKEAYRYAKSKRFIMRSQLDCYDSRLPGTGVFDIKTRAALPLRLDWLNHEENSGYLIRKAHGVFESFEREYYDLIRAAFLKYSFQARIGNMDGIFLAYHNTARIFGFQYVPLEEMEERLYGSTTSGDYVFQKCIGILEAVAEHITACFSDTSVDCLAETREGAQRMRVWIQPSTWTGTEEERPIECLDVTTASFVKGKRVAKGSAIQKANARWTVKCSIAKALESPDALRTSLEKARKRQLTLLNVPTGMSQEDMPEYWAKINFGPSDPSSSSSSSSVPASASTICTPCSTSDVKVSSTTGASSSSSTTDVEFHHTTAPEADADAGSTEPGAESAPLEPAPESASPSQTANITTTPSSSSLHGPNLWRTADKRIKYLRSLARVGRDETQRLADAEEGAPKLVWGQPDYVEHLQGRRAGGKTTTRTLRQNDVVLAASDPAYGDDVQGQVASSPSTSTVPRTTANGSLRVSADDNARLEAEAPSITEADSNTYLDARTPTGPAGQAR